MARVAKCGRATLEVVCRCLHSTDIAIPHLDEDGNPFQQSPGPVPDPDPAEEALSEAPSEEEDTEALFSDEEALSEVGSEEDSDYEDASPAKVIRKQARKERKRTADQISAGSSP